MGPLPARGFAVSQVRASRQLDLQRFLRTGFKAVGRCLWRDTRRFGTALVFKKTRFPAASSYFWLAKKGTLGSWLEYGFSRMERSAFGNLSVLFVARRL